MHTYTNTDEKSRASRSDKNTNSCPKTFNKTVTGYIFYHTNKILIFKNYHQFSYNDAARIVCGAGSM